MISGLIIRSPAGDTCAVFDHVKKCEDFIISDIKSRGGMSGSPLYLNQFKGYLPMGVLVAGNQKVSYFIPSYRIKEIIDEIESKRR